MSEVQKNIDTVLKALSLSSAGKDIESQALLEEIGPKAFTDTMAALIIEMNRVAVSSGCPVDVVFGYAAVGVKKATGVEVQMTMSHDTAAEDTQH